MKAQCVENIVSSCKPPINQTNQCHNIKHVEKRRKNTREKAYKYPKTWTTDQKVEKERKEVKKGVSERERNKISGIKFSREADVDDGPSEAATAAAAIFFSFRPFNFSALEWPIRQTFLNEWGHKCLCLDIPLLRSSMTPVRLQRWFITWLNRISRTKRLKWFVVSNIFDQHAANRWP